MSSVPKLALDSTLKRSSLTVASDSGRLLSFMQSSPLTKRSNVCAVKFTAREILFHFPLFSAALEPPPTTAVSLTVIGPVITLDDPDVPSIRINVIFPADFFPWRTSASKTTCFPIFPRLW